jgi:hypothetical protein
LLKLQALFKFAADLRDGARIDGFAQRRGRSQTRQCAARLGYACATQRTAVPDGKYMGYAGTALQGGVGLQVAQMMIHKAVLAAQSPSQLSRWNESIAKA